MKNMLKSKLFFKTVFICSLCMCALVGSVTLPSVTLLLMTYLVSGIVGFWAYLSWSGDLHPFQKWNLRKTGTVIVFAILGICSLFAVVCAMIDEASKIGDRS